MVEALDGSFLSPDPNLYLGMAFGVAMLLISVFAHGVLHDHYLRGQFGLRDNVLTNLGYLVYQSIETRSLSLADGGPAEIKYVTAIRLAVSSFQLAFGLALSLKSDTVSRRLWSRHGRIDV